jgi:lipopolysaccharide/colanic/teichoic acid biosynthesis glycosyltransferase
MHLGDGGGNIDHILFFSTKYWHIILAMFGATAGAVIWGWNQYIRRFCFRHEFDNYIRLHSQQHEDLKNLIQTVRNDMHDKHSELLYTIIESHSQRD